MPIQTLCLFSSGSTPIQILCCPFFAATLLNHLKPIFKLSPSLGGMLRVFKASGEEVLAIGYEEFVAMGHESEQPDSARALKCHIQRVSAQSRFKQRLLLLDGDMLSDDFVFTGPTDVQLILQHFEASSDDQIQHLQDAARNNDIQAMEQLLQRPQDPDLEVEGFPSALHKACDNGHIKIARLLLEANADKDRAFVNDGTIPLIMASVNGHLEVVRMLLEENADKDKAHNDGATPLFMASKFGQVEVVRLLLEENADKDKAQNDGATPLFVASQFGQVAVARLLLQANADKENAGEFGATPLIIASLKGHLEVARLLLEANADKDKATASGATPLIIASWVGQVDVARLLLEANADKDKAAECGATPLLMASKNGHLEVARLLMEVDA